MLQQLKHNDPRIVKLAIDVMVKILSLGKVGIVNCVVWFLDSPSCMIVFAISYLSSRNQSRDICGRTHPESTITHRNHERIIV